MADRFLGWLVCFSVGWLAGILADLSSSRLADFLFG